MSSISFSEYYNVPTKKDCIAVTIHGKNIRAN